MTSDFSAGRNPPASDATIIRWRLRWLANNAEELKEQEFAYLLSFERYFERNGTLTPRQWQTLEDIYDRLQ